MYGGRAIDNFDRRILNTYMDEYMGDFIFDTFQPFHFFVNEEVDYRIPDEGPRDNYIGKLIQVVSIKLGWSLCNDWYLFEGLRKHLAVMYQNRYWQVSRGKYSL